MTKIMNPTSVTPDGKPGDTNIIQTALQAGRELAPKVIQNPIQDGTPFVILRNPYGGDVIEYLRAREDFPPRKIGTVKLSAAESFLSYWHKHSNPRASQIYAAINPAKFTAVFDDHEATMPLYREHRAVYSIEHSPEWKEWMTHNGKPFGGNEEFARWVENQLPDITRPDGASMLQMALNFRYTQNASFGNQVNLNNGSAKLTYTNDAQGQSTAVACGEIQIPEIFEISIPVFHGLDEPKRALQCRLRWRVHEKSLRMHYEIIRPHQVADQAFADLIGEIENGTGTKVLFGSPE